MPGDDRLRLHHEQRFAPPGPEPGQHHPIDPISGAQWHSALPVLSSKHQELMAEREQLSFQVGATAKEVSDCGK